MDEINYAGLTEGTGAENTNSYIIDNTPSLGHWWTMTPAVDTNNMPYAFLVLSWIKNGSSFLSYYTETYSYIRPAISLKPSIMWARGVGTKENPYTVK